MVNTSTVLNIGSLAKQAKVNIQTVRYYERRGLLPRPERTASNYRIYTAATIRRIRFIKRSQRVGFTLKEIHDLLRLRTSPHSQCSDVKALSQAKLDDIDEKIRSLVAMRASLGSVVRSCPGHGPATDCPILDYLDVAL